MGRFNRAAESPDAAGQSDGYLNTLQIRRYWVDSATGRSLCSLRPYKDFVDRYEQGDPSEGYSDQEVLKRYGEVSHAVPPDQYAQAAQEALGKLSPEERAEFLKTLQERAAARGVNLPGKVASDPKDPGPGAHQST